ncbi:MAG: DUF58 domain-containing protein [Planctomycetes bacterium]|nr:DUF58 domain-containing protein [Planctomycetota bacterium]MBL7044128.1 DUF58 domain-containing protein [Pirellulaceae bacterium]
MSVHRRSAICREGYQYLLLMAFTFALAMIVEANLMFVVAGLLCGPLLLNWRWAVKALRRVDLRRRAPATVTAGEPLVVEIGLSNSRKRFGSWALRVRDQVCRADDSRPEKLLGPEVFFPRLRPGESRRLTYRGCLPQRGRYRLGPAKVSTRFPFGLVKRILTFSGSHDLTVLPRLGRLMPAWTVRHAEDIEGWQGGLRPTRAPGDFFGVREWESGDSVRWVHWRSTARHGRLAVCQFEKPRRRDIVLLVDLWQPREPDQDHLDNVELAVSFAATVVAELCARPGGSVVVGITGPTPVCVSGPASASLRQDVMDTLAVAQASDGDNLPALFENVMHQVAHGTRIWLVSTRDNDLEDECRFPGLRAGRHRQLAASGICAINTASPDFSEYFRAD